MRMGVRWLVAVVCWSMSAGLGLAQSTPQKVSGTIAEDMRELVQTPAIPGYEQELAAKIAAKLKRFSPKTDSLGSVTVTVGSGAPHRLLVAPLDEPGFVISRITAEGYLQVQRLPQNATLPLFNELHAAQPVKLETERHKWINGAVAGLSIHLQPGRQNPPSAGDLDHVFIDIGASSAAEARAAGITLLSPMALDRTFYEMANFQWTGTAVGDRFGAAALIELLRQIDPAKIKGTITIAFTTQQWTGGRGLLRVLNTQKPDELIFVGRRMRPVPVANAPPSTEPEAGFTKTPGSGVIFASAAPQDELTGLAAELKKLAEENGTTATVDYSAPLVPRTATTQPPARTVHLSVATAWPSTPGEVVDGQDVAGVVALLEAYLQGGSQKVELGSAPAIAEPKLPSRPNVAPAVETILRQLVETYGVSGGHESNVKKAVAQLLPPWAKTETDDAGNLILRWHGKTQRPGILVVAHMDEIGYEIKSILPDGRLELENKGGGVLAFFLGHPALVHSANGIHPGVLELPEGWEKPDFKWPRGQRLTFHMDVGAKNPDQAGQMGIKTGDFVTIPKQFHMLLGSRASARAFDDRVGCTALIAAAWALGPELQGQNITFVWSTSEELGLEGATAVAKRLASQGAAPEYVFAVDTFVSSDSPLESPRFADALLGKGFVVRAVDNSTIVPRKLVNKVLAIAKAAKIPAQYGVTGGSNDGSVFLPFGSTNVALGWPLRYAHSPGEVIDVRDVNALARIIAAVARNW